MAVWRKMKKICGHLRYRKHQRNYAVRVPPRLPEYVSRRNGRS